MAQEKNDQAEVARRLTEWGRARWGAGFAVRAIAKPESGSSSETYLLDVEGGPEGRAAWVLRLEPRGRQVYQDPSVERQFRILQRLGEAPEVPTPKVFTFEPDAAVLGAPFFTMQRLEGRTPPDMHHSEGVLVEATPAERERMWLSSLETMARLHRLSPEPFGFLGLPQHGEAGVDQELGRWDSYRDWARIAPRPAFVRAREWLEARRPRGGGVGLAWGDARLGNVLLHESRCVALLDWETASLGGAETDLGWWLCYESIATDISGVPRLEGVGGRDETIAAWEGFAGRRAEAMEWHEVFATYRFSLVYERAIGLMAPEARPPNPALAHLARLLP